MRKMLMVFTLAAAAAAASGARQDAVPCRLAGVVTRVSDGDTIWVSAAAVRHKVKLAKIDAPESNQPYGKESAEFLRRLVYGRQVEVLWTAKDRYGRIIGAVTLKHGAEAIDVNLAMVNNGFAWHYSFNDKTPAYAMAEQSARQSRVGLWRAAAPVNPYLWRKSGRTKKLRGKRVRNDAGLRSCRRESGCVSSRARSPLASP